MHVQSDASTIELFLPPDCSILAPSIFLSLRAKLCPFDNTFSSRNVRKLTIRLRDAAETGYLAVRPPAYGLLPYAIILGQHLREYQEVPGTTTADGAAFF